MGTIQAKSRYHYTPVRNSTSPETPPSNPPNSNRYHSLCHLTRALLLCFILLLLFTLFSFSFSSTDSLPHLPKHQTNGSDTPVHPLQLLRNENFQNRAEQDLGGKQDGFRMVNEERKEKRVADMAELDAIREGFCKGVHDKGNKWTLLPRNLTLIHANNSINMAMLRMGWRTEQYDLAQKYAATVVAQRRICEAPHPRLKHAKVRVERIGPLFGVGNNDWISALGFSDALSMRQIMRNRTIFIIGRMFATVDAAGKKFNYPPLHTHHAHVYPYTIAELGRRTIPKNMRSIILDRSEHHVLLQAHGDAICKEHEGGTACLLEQLPDGQGYRVFDSSGFWFNFEINDVRSGAVDPLEYYVDIAMIYTELPQVPVTFMQMGSPPLGLGWRTYVYPLDPNHNFIYYKYTNYLLGDGTLNNFILHTHMSSFDSIYVFKGRSVYATLEEYRKQHRGVLPHVFECKEQDPAASKREILRRVQATRGAELICEGVRPSMELFCEKPPYEERCIYRDKRIGLNCKSNVRLRQNETIVVLAFNRVRNVSTTPLTRQSDKNTLAVVSPFGMGYMAHQHSFFRADFVSDRAKEGKVKASSGNPQNDYDRGNYAPPSLFLYRRWPEVIPSGYVAATRRLISGCKANMDYRVDLPWNIIGL